MTEVRQEGTVLISGKGLEWFIFYIYLMSLVYLSFLFFSFFRSNPAERSPPSLWFPPLRRCQSWANQANETEEVWQMNETAARKKNFLLKSSKYRNHKLRMSVLNKKIQNHSLTYLRGLCCVALFVKVALKWINVTYEKWLWCFIRVQRLMSSFWSVWWRWRQL